MSADQTEDRPTLLFDKSVFQSLGVAAHERLANAYNIVGAPVLYNEVAGNLKRGRTFSTGNSPRAQAAMLARKFLGTYQILKSWKGTCREELLGSSIMMSGVPVLADSVEGYAANGGLRQIRVNVDGRLVSPQEALVQRVLNGTASEYDHDGPPRQFDAELALGALAPLAQPLLLPKSAASERATVEAVDQILDDYANCRELLRWSVDSICRVAEPRDALRQKVQVRWGAKGRQPLREHAPFTFHCARVTFLYFVGLRVWPKPREPNDERDLEYLRYLPFCNVFATDDRLSRAMAAHLLDPRYQRVVTKAELEQHLREPSDYS